MDRLFQNIKFNMNEKLFLKDPESSSLGKKIVANGMELIDDIGFEAFTFKKLGVYIGSNESSIYRYFVNKHNLLLYLTSWYWRWLEYKLVLSTNGMSDRMDKLARAIEIIGNPVEDQKVYDHIDLVVLHRIVINESLKSFLTKEVDEENKEGYFVVYKRLVHRLQEMIVEVNDSYPYPSSLASTLLETCLHQHFLKDHFPTLTNCSDPHLPSKFMVDMVTRTLK